MLSSLNGETRIHVTIGDPIAQVKSPAGVTQAFAARGCNAIMIPIQVTAEDADDFIRMAKRIRNLDGIVATVPHKFTAFRNCDTSSERSRVRGVANVMRRNADGTWSGDMTDGGGFVAALHRHGFDPKGKRALLVGAGGAGSAVGLALLMDGLAELTVNDIDAGRRDGLIGRISGHGRVKAGTNDPAGYDLVVNATPLGMKAGDPLPFDPARIAASTFVADLITKPVISPLLETARGRGCRIQTGEDLFLAQVDIIADFLLGVPA